MTYLSQFPKSALKAGAPLRPKTNPKKARAYGKGLFEYYKLFYKCYNNEDMLKIFMVQKKLYKVLISIEKF